MTRKTARPLSPHLSVWRWGPAMTVSIVHRVTGNGLATVGAVLLVAWFVAAASGAEAYATYMDWADSPIGILVAVGLSWFFFQHMVSGIRHFVLDTGAGYGLDTNNSWSFATFAISTLLTVALWAIVFLRNG